MQAAVKQLDYLPSRAGSALRSGRSRIVALILPDRFNSYNQGLAASLERAVRHQGRIMVLCTTDESPAMQDEVLREMRSQLACGIVLLGAVDSPGLRVAAAGGEPIVLVNRRFGGKLKAPFVGLGLLQPVVFHGPLFSSATRDRVRGFCERFRDRVRNDPVDRFELTAFSKEEGYACAGALLSDGRAFEAAFCTSDEIAYGVARACREAGLIPGDDVTLFGFDGSPINDFLAPWLNTVCVDVEEYGPAIVGLLQGYWSGRPPKPDAELLVPFSLKQATIRPPHNAAGPSRSTRRRNGFVPGLTARSLPKG